MTIPPIKVVYTSRRSGIQMVHIRLLLVFSMFGHQTECLHCKSKRVSPYQAICFQIGISLHKNNERIVLLLCYCQSSSCSSASLVEELFYFFSALASAALSQ